MQEISQKGLQKTRDARNFTKGLINFQDIEALLIGFSKDFYQGTLIIVWKNCSEILWISIILTYPMQK